MSTNYLFSIRVFITCPNVDFTQVYVIYKDRDKNKYLLVIFLYKSFNCIEVKVLKRLFKIDIVKSINELQTKLDLLNIK